jgi:hypothetical protein
VVCVFHVGLHGPGIFPCAALTVSGAEIVLQDACSSLRRHAAVKMATAAPSSLRARSGGRSTERGSYERASVLKGRKPSARFLPVPWTALHRRHAPRDGCCSVIGSGAWRPAAGEKPPAIARILFGGQADR